MNYMKKIGGGEQLYPITVCSFLNTNHYDSIHNSQSVYSYWRIDKMPPNPPPLKSHYHSVIWRLYYKVEVILNILTLLMKMIDLKLNRHFCICTAFSFFFTVTLQFSLRIQFYWLVGWNRTINIEKWVIIVLTQKKRETTQMYVTGRQQFTKVKVDRWLSLVFFRKNEYVKNKATILMFICIKVL